jgi:hypothetical protein
VRYQAALQPATCTTSGFTREPREQITAVALDR